MHIYTKNRILVFLLALLCFTAQRSAAQCGFIDLASRTDCVGQLTLDLEDSTSGAGSTTDWTVTVCGVVLHSNGQHQFSYIPPCPGRIVVVMTDTINGQVCRVVDSNFVANPNPTLDMTFSTPYTCLGEPVCMINNSTVGAGCDSPIYSIAWGNGIITDSVGCFNGYTTNGTYSVAVIMTNSCGCHADTTYTNAITVTGPPQASFTGAPLTSCTYPLTTTFTAGTTSVPNITYFWYVAASGSGNFIFAGSSASNVFNYTFANPGMWDVKLVVEDVASGCSTTTTQSSYVTTGSAQAACYTASPTTGCAPLTVQYAPCVAGATTYNWSTPGGSPSSYSSATGFGVIYYSPGHYTSQLIVTYTGGCRDTVSLYPISVGTAYTLNFDSIAPNTACTVPFSDSVHYTGQPCPSCTFTWGPTPNADPSSHTGTKYTLSSFGCISPYLSVSDSFGCSETIIRTDYICSEPLVAQVNIATATASTCNGNEFIITNVTSGAASTIWNFGSTPVDSTHPNVEYIHYTTAGWHTFTMTVTNTLGCTASLTDSVFTSTKINDSIQESPHIACLDSNSIAFQVIFLNTVDTPTLMRIFPEGIGAGLPTFNIVPQDSGWIYKYTYPDYGDFHVCWQTSNHGCFGDTICADSVIIHPPSAGYTKLSVCSPDSFYLVQNCHGANRYTWTVDGVTYPQQDTLRVYVPTCSVQHHFTITAYNDTFNCMNMKSDSFFIPCIGTDFTVSTYHVCTGGRVFYYIYLTDSTKDSPPTSIQWSTQDTGQPPVFNNANIGNVFDPVYYPGIASTCARLTYANGCIDTLCKLGIIRTSQANAVIHADASAGCIPFNVQFTDTPSTDFYSTFDSVSWDFGDGTSIALTPITPLVENPLHTYRTVGQFIVTHYMRDANGCSSTVQYSITSDSIKASFMLSDDSTCTTNSTPQNPITISNTSSGFPTTFQWSLTPTLGATDSTPGNVPSFTTQFANQGTTNVCLIAIDQAGVCRDTACRNLVVANPVADYYLAPGSDTFYVCPPAQVYFRDTSMNQIVSYSWELSNNNQNATFPDPAAIYTYPGIYPITEIVTSSHGCVDSITKYNINIKGPFVTMTATVPGGCPCQTVVFHVVTHDADSIQFTPGGINASPSFQYVRISPRGTASNPTITDLSFTYCNVGDVLPVIKAFDFSSGGCYVFYDSLIVPIPIDTPSPAFSTRIIGCGTDSICFTNLTHFSATHAYDSANLWTFGDGTTDTSYSPCHHYPGPGDYSVSLSVTDNIGCQKTIVSNVHVPKAPVTFYTVDDTSGCAPLLIHFRDSVITDDSTTVASSIWSYGNGTSISSTLDTTSYNYTVAGIDTASLIVTDGYGCSDTLSHIISLAPAPAVTVGPNPTICLGDTATLSGSGTSTIAWTPNYNIDDTTSATPRVWPTVDTTYYITIGTIPRCTISDSVRVFVSAITGTDTVSGACSNSSASFRATSLNTHGTTSSYAWSFGDGASGTGQTTTHHYPTSGTYSDTLTLTNSFGCKDTLYSTVTILDTPHASLSIAPINVCQGSPVTITNTSTAGASGALANYFYEFPGTANANVPNTSPYQYTDNNVGAYTVVLVDSDVNQCTGTASAQFTVHPGPTVTIDTTGANCVGVPGQLVADVPPATGGGAITQYQWAVDGVAQAAGGDTLPYTFTTTGSHTASVSVTDQYGCSNSTTVTFSISSSPQATLNAPDTTVCVGHPDTLSVTGLRYDRIQWVPSTWVNNPDSPNVIITPLQTIAYQVYVYYKQCIPTVLNVNINVVDSIPITVAADPENIVLGLSSNVTSDVKGNIDSIIWSPDTTLSCRNCMSPIATPAATTTYTATIYYGSANAITCTNTASVTITVITSCTGSLIYVPNTFTPNGDSVNDVFRLRGQGITKVNYLRVYDRWGKLVYDAENAPNADAAAWNGGLNNDPDKPETSGVFSYVFEITCLTGQTVTGKGNITLIR